VQVFFDLDGTLSDLVRQAMSRWNRHVPMSQVKWRLWEAMGISADEFWDSTDFEFWSTMPMLKDGMDLFRIANSYFDASDIGFLTAPTDHGSGCRDGKAFWVKTHFPGFEDRLFQGVDKAFIAGPSKLLIDDKDENVDAFHEAGGLTWLVPRPWNRKSHSCDSEGDMLPHCIKEFESYLASFA
jgi:hypothetical protein